MMNSVERLAAVIFLQGIGNEEEIEVEHIPETRKFKNSKKCLKSKFSSHHHNYCYDLASSFSSSGHSPPKKYQSTCK